MYAPSKLSRLLPLSKKGGGKSNAPCRVSLLPSASQLHPPGNPIGLGGRSGSLSSARVLLVLRGAASRGGISASEIVEPTFARAAARWRGGGKARPKSDPRSSDSAPFTPLLRAKRDACAFEGLTSELTRFALCPRRMAESALRAPVAVAGGAGRKEGREESAEGAGQVLVGECRGIGEGGEESWRWRSRSERNGQVAARPVSRSCWSRPRWRQRGVDRKVERQGANAEVLTRSSAALPSQSCEARSRHLCKAFRTVAVQERS